MASTAELSPKHNLKGVLKGISFGKLIIHFKALKF